MAALAAPSSIAATDLVIAPAPCGLSIAASMRYQPLLLRVGIARPMLSAAACART
jgi:hypothetical protein